MFTWKRVRFWAQIMVSRFLTDMTIQRGVWKWCREKGRVFILWDCFEYYRTCCLSGHCPFNQKCSHKFPNYPLRVTCPTEKYLPTWQVSEGPWKLNSPCADDCWVRPCGDGSFCLCRRWKNQYRGPFWCARGVVMAPELPAQLSTASHSLLSHTPPCCLECLPSLFPLLTSIHFHTIMWTA